MPLSSKPTLFALNCDIGAGPCVISPVRCWLLGFVNRALEGQWRPQQSKDSPLLVPMRCLQHNSQQASGLGVPTSVALTDQPSPINFSSTSWARPMEQLRPTPSSECSDYPAGLSCTSAPANFSATRQATPMGHAFHHISSPPRKLSFAGRKPWLSLQFCPGSLPLDPRGSSCSVRLLLCTFRIFFYSF